MPRTPNPDEVRHDLENILHLLRVRPEKPLSVYLLNGKTLAYDHRLLLGDDDSLGPVARLMLMRCKLQLSAKEIQSTYKAECESQNYPSTNYTTLQYAFSLTTTQLRSLPPMKSLVTGMGALLDTWRADHGNDGLGLPPHPEPSQLFSKPFFGDNACDLFLEYLEYTSSPVTQLASGRHLDTSADRARTLERVTQYVVDGNSMLVNVYAKEHWDGLRAFSEALASKIAVTEAKSAQSLTHRAFHTQRDVLFVPLRANALPVESNAANSLLVDEHMGLDRMMGILTAFTEHGSAADVLNAQPMDEETGFNKTLQRIRESLMKTARIIVFDGVYDSGGANSCQTLERVLADEHYRFVINRMMEPLLSSTSDPHALDIFNRNRFIITSNSEHVGNSIWSSLHPVKGPAMQNLPVTELLKTTDQYHYDDMLKRSAAHAEQVISLLRHSTLNYCRNDVVNQLLSCAVSLLARLFTGHDAPWQNSELNHAADSFFDHLKPPTSGIADAKTIVRALLACLHKHSQEFGNTSARSDSIDLARLWAELLLLITVTPEGLTLDTIDRILKRVSMTPDDIEHPLPSLQSAKDTESLDFHVENFVLSASSIAGFIRREFVEGPEVEDHPLECWEGLLTDIENRKKRRDNLTLDFRYPEIRLCLQHSEYWDILEIDRYLLHRVISEIALQYQTSFFRYTDHRHRGSVRNWRRLLTSLYHGLASIGHPEIKTHRNYGVRGVDLDGTSQEYWLFLYAKLYRKLMEGPEQRRISRIMGLEDLNIALLQLFSKPWLLHPHWVVAGTSDYPSFIEYFDNTSQPTAEYYLNRMRAALSRGEVDGAYPGWYERFSNMSSCPSTDERLQMEYILLEKHLHTVESISIEHVVDVLQHLTKTGDAFNKLQLTVCDPAKGTGLVQNLPAVGRNHHDNIPGLMSLVDLPEVTKLVQMMVDVVKPTTVALALSYFGMLSRFESDRADFADGYRLVKRIPEGLRGGMQDELQRTLTLSGPQCNELRKQALARMLVIEAARVALFRIDPTGHASTRSNAQGRTAVRLAIRLDDEFRQQLSKAQSVPSAYFRFARRMADSCTRMSWQYPRDQANVLVMEAMMLRSESERITSSETLSEDDSALAIRLLEAARATIGRAEHVLTTPNLASRSRLRMTLERYNLNRDLAMLHKRCTNAELSRIFTQHARYDMAMLQGAVNTDNARPYWKLIVSLQSGLDVSAASV